MLASIIFAGHYIQDQPESKGVVIPHLVPGIMLRTTSMVSSDFQQEKGIHSKKPGFYLYSNIQKIWNVLFFKVCEYGRRDIDNGIGRNIAE